MKPLNFVFLVCLPFLLVLGSLFFKEPLQALIGISGILLFFAEFIYGLIFVLKSLS